MYAHDVIWIIRDAIIFPFYGMMNTTKCKCRGSRDLRGVHTNIWHTTQALDILSIAGNHTRTRRRHQRRRRPPSTVSSSFDHPPVRRDDW